MTPEERQLLIQTHRMVEENNKLLRKMHRAALWGRLWHALYWLIIIGASIGAYLYVQPFVDQFSKLYGGFTGDVEAAKGAVSKLEKIGEFFNRGQ